MDIEAMCRHYQQVFNKPEDVLDWVEHDLRHMGLDADQVRHEINIAKEYLKLEK